MNAEKKEPSGSPERMSTINEASARYELTAQNLKKIPNEKNYH